MMNFFPTPYPDELLHSIFCRYHLRSGNTSARETLSQLFGNRDIVQSFLYPHNIEGLIANMPSESEYTVNQIIYDHTLYPLMTAFMPTEGRKSVFDMMKGSFSFSRMARTGMVNGFWQFPEYLRFCPSCIKDDRLTYGEAYWHRVHQAPCVLVCPHHKEVLHDSNLFMNGSYKNFYDTMEDYCQKHANLPSYESSIIEKLVVLSEDVLWILQNHEYVNEINIIKKKYSVWLFEMGLAATNGRIHRKDLFERFIRFYGYDFLNVINFYPEIQRDTWLKSMAYERCNTAHPIKNLLFIRFLCQPVQDFFKHDKENKPFGDGPWPCLNSASKHYGKSVIKEYQLFRYNNSTRIPGGIFSCPICGFSYSRGGVDNTEQDRYKIAKVRDYGHWWKKMLKKYVEVDHLQVKDISERLKISIPSVKRNAVKLGLDTTWKRKDLEEASIRKMSKTHKSPPEIIRDEYREKLINLRKMNPSATRHDLFKMDQPTFCWLRYHDREWLTQNMPPPKCDSTFYRVDWAKTDRELSEQVKASIDNLLISTDRPVRISARRIGIMLQMENYLSSKRKLCKLPITKTYIDEFTETIEEFHMRSIQWAIGKLKAESRKISRTNINVLTGIKYKILERYENMLKQLY